MPKPTRENGFITQTWLYVTFGYLLS